MIRILFLLLPIFAFSQKTILKGTTNTARVSGVTLNEAGNKLLDMGYVIEKSDSIFQFLKTEFRDGTGKSEWMKIRLFVRIKDSVAIVTGEWYNTMLIGSKLLGQEQTIENSIYKIEYTSGNPKNCFNEMNFLPTIWYVRLIVHLRFLLKALF